MHWGYCDDEATQLVFKQIEKYLNSWMRVIIFEDVLKLHQFDSFRIIEEQHFWIERIDFFKGLEKPQSIKHKRKPFN